MRQIYHREITIEALGGYFKPDVLETVITANLGQDALRYQIGHDHFHYDASAFSAGDKYCQELRQAVLTAVQREDMTTARVEFGRLTHTLQDFYAHSNYISLWREDHPTAHPDEVDPELAVFFTDPRLHSGKLYYPLEALSFIALFKPFVLPLLPRDSHAWMNIDDPSRPNFGYAFAAALKRTKAEYLRLTKKFSPNELALFTGLDARSSPKSS